MQEILAQSSDSEYEENNQNVDSNNSEKKEDVYTQFCHLHLFL